jgi:hypothetical protein
MNKIAGLLCVLLLVACDAAQDDALFFDEPELTPEELAMLPDGLAPDPEHAEQQLAETAPAEDDAATFDDAAAELLYDEDVVDDEDPAVAPGPVAFQPLLHSGLHPRASDALRAAGVSAWRIVQTIGNAPASAGYHLADGSVNGHPYTAAIDLSVSGLSNTQIRNLLERLAKVGYAGWYRQNGHDGWSGANHIHAVYANCKMKAVLRAQIRSWLLGRNGLVSNTIYGFHKFSAEARRIVKGKFAQSDFGTSNGGGGVSGRVNTAGAPLTIRAGASTSTSAIGSLPDGTFITIRCQKFGSSVTGTYGTSRLWDKTGGGFVADAYVSTGSDGQVAPTCP